MLTSLQKELVRPPPVAQHDDLQSVEGFGGGGVSEVKGLYGGLGQVRRKRGPVCIMLFLYYFSASEDLVACVVAYGKINHIFAAHGAVGVYSMLVGGKRASSGEERTGTSPTGMLQVASCVVPIFIERCKCGFELRARLQAVHRL